MNAITTAAQPSNLLTKLVANLDIDAFDDVPTGRLVIVNPKTKEPTTTYVDLASAEHESRKRLDLARTRRLRAEFAANGKIETTDPLDDVEDETDYLVASVLGWNVTRGGAPVECTPANVRALLIDSTKQWFRAQVRVGIHKTELFIAASANA